MNGQNQNVQHMHESTEDLMSQFMNLEAMAPPSTSGRAMESVNVDDVAMQDFDFDSADDATVTPEPLQEGSWPQDTRNTLARGFQRHSHQPNPVHPYCPLVAIDSLPGHVYHHATCGNNLAAMRALYPMINEPTDPTRLVDVNSVLGQYIVDDDANMVLDECDLVQRTPYVHGLDSYGSIDFDDEFNEQDELNGGYDSYAYEFAVEETAAAACEVGFEEGMDRRAEDPSSRNALIDPVYRPIKYIGYDSSDAADDSEDDEIKNPLENQANESWIDETSNCNSQARRAVSQSAPKTDQIMHDDYDSDSSLSDLDSQFGDDMDVVLPHNIQQVVAHIKKSAAANRRGLPNKSELARRWGTAFFGARGDLLLRGSAGMRDYTREQLGISKPIWDYITSKDRV